MVLSAVSRNNSFTSENDRSGISMDDSGKNSGKKMGFLGRYLIVPIENVVRYIADGACAFCHNIRSFLIVVCSPLYDFFRGRAGATPEPESDLEEQGSTASEEDPALHQSGADMPSGRLSETEGRSEPPGLLPSCDEVLPGRQACSSPENYGKQNGFPVSVSLGQDGSCMGTFPADREGEAVCAPLLSSPVVSPDAGSAAPAMMEADSWVEGRFADDEPLLVSAGPHPEPAGEPKFPSASDIEPNSSPSASGSLDGGEEAAVVMPGPDSDAAALAEEIAIMKQGFPLDDASSDMPEDTSFSDRSFNTADESSDVDDDAFETADEASDIDDGALLSEVLSDAEYNVMRNQSVFTAPHFVDLPHYDPIRKFLIANQDLRSGFPEEVTVNGDKRRQWSDLDFQHARLNVRDTGYCKRSGAPERLADKAFFPLVGVDVFQNDLDNGRYVCISQCPDSFSCRWLQRRNAPGIFLINHILHNYNIVFYYAVPELEAIQESCRPLLKMLVSGNKEELKKTMERFKMILPAARIAKYSMLTSMVGSTILLGNHLQLEGFCGESPESGSRYTEIHIDIRKFKNIITAGVFSLLRDRLEKSLHSLRLPIGFSIEPMAEDERAKMEKKLKTPIDSHLPEHVFCGVELFRPDIGIGRRELPRLQLPPSTAPSDR